MDKIMKYLLLIFLGILLLIKVVFLPLVSINSIFLLGDLLGKNALVTHFTAGEILGYIGNILGALIGGIVTFGALYLTIKYEKNIRVKEEEINIQPYLYFEITKYYAETNHSAKIDGKIHNVGAGTAFKADLIQVTKNDRQRFLKQGSIIGINNYSELCTNIDMDTEGRYFFKFFDLKGNLYKQEFKAKYMTSFDKMVVLSYIPSEPIKIKTSKEIKDIEDLILNN